MQSTSMEHTQSSFSGSARLEIAYAMHFLLLLYFLTYLIVLACTVNDICAYEPEIRYNLSLFIIIIIIIYFIIVGKVVRVHAYCNEGIWLVQVSDCLIIVNAIEILCLCRVAQSAN